MCNLTEVVVRPDDTHCDIIEKIKIATLLGTYQSSVTHFRYVNKEWQENCEEERLLGVSLTGIYDNPITYDISKPSTEERLIKFCKLLRKTCREENAKWAARFGIPKSKSITCVKPSGTVSQLAQCSSGIHPAYAKHYIRRVTGSAHDPISQFMKDQHIPCEGKVGDEENNLIFSFPIKSPETSRTRDEVSALEMLRLWMIYNLHYAEHQVSCTIYIRPHEWNDVARYVFENFDEITGLSFLPYFEEDHSYPQLPFETICEDEFKDLRSEMPSDLDWDGMADYEKEDYTTSARSLACSSGTCSFS